MIRKKRGKDAEKVGETKCDKKIQWVSQTFKLSCSCLEKRSKVNTHIKLANIEEFSDPRKKPHR